MRPFRLVKYIYAGLFAAVLAVLSQLAIPMPGAVPLTLQTFGVALCAYVLGWKLGTLSYLIYFLLGLAGVPVFSNFTGGIGKLFGPTGGFLIGFFLDIYCSALLQIIYSHDLNVKFNISFYYCNVETSEIN